MPRSTCSSRAATRLHARDAQWSLGVVALRRRLGARAARHRPGDLDTPRARACSLLAIYLLMGWVVDGGRGAARRGAGLGRLRLVAAGGLVYTAGIVFYLYDERYRHFHGIWHLFVLAGSARTTWPSSSTWRRGGGAAARDLCAAANARIFPRHLRRLPSGAGTAMSSPAHRFTKSGHLHPPVACSPSGARRRVRRHRDEPLYALKECFSPEHGIAPTLREREGPVSLITWSMAWVIAWKYLGVMMRADNDGEAASSPCSPRACAGCITSPAPAGSCSRSDLRRVDVYGDSMITPAISVLSAMEGLEIATPVFSQLGDPAHARDPHGPLPDPASRHGERRRLFGPVTAIWFAAIAPQARRASETTPTSSSR